MVTMTGGMVVVYVSRRDASASDSRTSLGAMNSRHCDSTERKGRLLRTQSADRALWDRSYPAVALSPSIFLLPLLFLTSRTRNESFSSSSCYRGNHSTTGKVDWVNLRTWSWQLLSYLYKKKNEVSSHSFQKEISKFQKSVEWSNKDLSWSWPTEARGWRMWGLGWVGWGKKE